MIFTREKEFFKLLFYSYMTSNQDIASDVAGGGGGGGCLGQVKSVGTT